MKKILLVLLFVIILLGGGFFVIARVLHKSFPPLTLMSKTQQKPSNIWGVFSGTLPCADCSGLQTDLVLFVDTATQHPTSYMLSYTYTGRLNAPIITWGTWSMAQGNAKDPHAQIIVLDADKPGHEQFFLNIKNTKLQMLDKFKSEITSPFPMTLAKQTVTLANPASTNCIQQHGALLIQKDAQGNQYGMCVFSNGKSCDEWALFQKNKCLPYKSSQ